MKFKLNKKILVGVGLSSLLLMPIFLTSCGSSSSTQQTVVNENIYGFSTLGYDYHYSPSIGDKYDSIATLYEKYGSKIYYRDSNGLLTLDLSKLVELKELYTFAFGSFENEINRLILPPNLELATYAAFYPNTTNGFLYAKNGINPMFKVIDKPIPRYNGDKYYFQLDVSNIFYLTQHVEYNTKGYNKKIGLPSQIFPSFDFTNSSNLYDKFKLIDETQSSYDRPSFVTPSFPLNLLSNTNYLKFYSSDYNINSLKSYVSYDTVRGRYIIDFVGFYSLFPDLYFPFGKATNSSAPTIYYQDPVTNKDIMPAIVSHPYLFKYILYTICQNQLTKTYNNTLKRYVYATSNDIFSNNGDALTISFINQFTEGQANQEVINISLDQSGILELLNYDLTNPSSTPPTSIRPEDVTLLNKWYSQYGMLDNWN